MARPKVIESPVNYTLCLPRELRDAFVLSCSQRDEQASAVLRRFMRGWLELNPPQPVAASSVVTIEEEGDI